MKSKFYHNSTKVGIVLSFLCAVHCIAMPILMVAFPFLEHTVLHDPIIEWVTLSSLIVLGVFSLNHYRLKHHGSQLPMIVFSAGVIVCLLALVSGHALHHKLMIAGSIVIAISQIMNLTMKNILSTSAAPTD